MSRQKKMPDDVRQTCIQYVKGYERRKKEYNLRRSELMNITPNNIVTIKDKNDPENEEKSQGILLPGSHNASRTTEDITERLQGLEDNPETKRMRAVEFAAKRVGRDLCEKDREVLINAIFKSCIEGKNMPFERLGVEGMERTCFYNRRTKFLLDIAKFMELI